MRLRILLSLAAILAVPLRAVSPPLLEDALLKVAQDKGRWAYTESDIVRNGQGKTLNSTVVRFDPSRPYPEQFLPLKIDDRAPTRTETEKYRERGVRRGRSLEKAENAGRPVPGRTLGDLVDLNSAHVFAEDATTVTYEVPLRADNNERFPPDRFQVLIRVSKAGRSLEHVSVHLRAPMRIALILKVKSGEIDAEFALVDSGHNPVMTAIRGDGTLSILFMPVARRGEMIRTDFKHVVPYDERFNVHIGAAKALDF